MVGSLLAALAVAAVSPSDLGVYVRARDLTAEAILGSCPRVATWSYLDATANTEILAFKTFCPGTVVVFQLAPTAVITVTDPTTPDPAFEATAYWSSNSSPLFAAIAQQLDWIEVKELRTTPSWYSDPAAAQWAARFWTALVGTAANQGFHLLVGSLAAGQPQPVTIDGSTVNAFCPTADAMKTSFGTSWAWSAHAYSATPTQDVGMQVASGALHYRITACDCALQGLPIFLAEGGLNESGVTNSWSDPAALCWLVWLDGVLRQDPDVKGLALFEAGEAGPSDLTPIKTGLASYLDGGSPPSCPASDGGTLPACSSLDGGTGGGGTGTQGGQTNPGGPTGGGTLTHSSSSCSTGGAAAWIAMLPVVANRARARARARSRNA